MNKSILVTGIAGSGKTVVCKELKRLGYKAYNIEGMKDLFEMIDKKTGKPATNYNKHDPKSVRQHRWICNKKKLQKLINENLKGIVFYCGTASNIDELLSLFNKIFLLKVNKKVLGKRLTTRTSHDFGRAPEVQKLIFDWKDWWENNMEEKGAIVINANRKINVIAKEIIKRANSKN